jgi:hypothetical protein
MGMELYLMRSGATCQTNFAAGGIARLITMTKRGKGTQQMRRFQMWCADTAKAFKKTSRAGLKAMGGFIVNLETDG